ncbi:hypothetical protein EAI_10022 [Harpegnathos saltator]|uniref:SEFIR domain-containing protein n=2 Tax=Harpegnathos saltator TaxID=610380 RepID=E2BJ84_HARSA|nr:hypothetical protein EAI_10022 [Harpegnathos saltator]
MHPIYDPIYDERYEINLTLDASLSVDTGVLLKLKLIPHLDKTTPCSWNGVTSIDTWSIILENSTGDENPNCKINRVWENKKYTKTVQCNYQVQTTLQPGYCLILFILDERCEKDTIWRPPMNKNIPCAWLKRCTKVVETSQHIENITMSSKLLPATSPYILFPIIVIILVVLAIVGTLYFMHHFRIRNECVNLYVNPQQDDFTNPTCLKSTDFNIVETNNSNKDIDRDKLTYNDIVLVYTKGSASFIAMMKDFREMLTKMCSCTVHDWHDGAEWNDVARVGAVLWFTDLLNSGCRVVWIDTPATRSVVISNSRESDTNLNKLSKYYEIGDFRDVAFPVVLELAKRNTKDLVFQYRKHFVVRFEGLASSENVNDPFLDLSPHTRYLMPQHFAQLCTDLSTIKPADSKCEMKAEEDLLQQRLKFMRMESIM